MNNDFARSLERVARSEERRAKLSGFGTPAAQALVRQYWVRCSAAYRG